MYARKAFLILLISMFALSGCGQSDNPLTENFDNRVNEEGNMGLAETEDTAETEDAAETADNAVKPSEVPVNSKAEDIYYHGEAGSELLRAYGGCVSDGENVYFNCNMTDLYVMPVGAEEYSRANIDNPEGLKVCSIAMDIYGTIHLLMADSDYEKWFIWRLDESYSAEKVIDISAYFDTTRGPSQFLVDKDGTYYLQWPVNRDGIIVDSEGALKHRFTPKSLGVKWIYRAAVGKDGQIYLVHGYEDLEMGELDVENCSLKEEASSLCFPAGSNTFTMMSGGTDTNLLLFSPYNGVWACDMEKGVLENRVPLSDISIDKGMEYYPLIFLPDGRLLLLEWSEEEYCLKYIPVGK